jgi:CubicO group peptidase (beta-lactamase class C family)
VFLNRVLIALVVSVIAIGAVAQSGFAQRNLPPVAAPTSTIEVAPIEVVRSVAELVNDFGGGLIEGLMPAHGVTSAAILAVQGDRIITARTFGCCPQSVASFGQGLASSLLASVAAMQLVERQMLRLSGGVPGSQGVTVEQLLTYQADPALLRDLIETASGTDFAAYVSRNIHTPLAGDDPQQFVGRLLIALLNDGAFEGRRLLLPETVRLMRETHFTLHPELPGWTYGLVEMPRNGRRALQWDGAWSDTPASEARIVLVPEADLAYFIVIEGHAAAPFWRTLDDRLFDRILPRRAPAATDGAQGVRPDADAARAVAGAYEAGSDPLSSAAPLKTQGRRLLVRAMEDGGLVLSGGENGLLAPQPGGYWAAEGGNLNAAAQDGRLILSSGLYRPLRLWKRPEFFASLALTFALAAGGALYGERRAQRTGKGPGRIGVALLLIVAALLVAAVFAWHASPAFS